MGVFGTTEETNIMITTIIVFLKYFAYAFTASFILSVAAGKFIKAGSGR